MPVSASFQLVRVCVRVGLDVVGRGRFNQMCENKCSMIECNAFVNELLAKTMLIFL